MGIFILNIGRIYFVYKNNEAIEHSIPWAKNIDLMHDNNK